MTNPTPAVTGARETSGVKTSDIRDDDFDDSVIEGVAVEPGGYAVTHNGGWTLWVENPPMVPRIGDSFRTYGGGLGCEVRGIAINGEVVRYQTDADMRAKNKRNQARRDKKRKQEAIARRPETERRIAALPTGFQDRINRFIAVSPDFEWDNLPYELFTCEQAVIIANAFAANIDGLKGWVKLDWKAQKEIVPGISDDHSGNTFGAACRLAWIHLTTPQLVEQEHGALCPLVGCMAYGCFAVEGERAA